MFIIEIMRKTINNNDRRDEILACFERLVAKYGVDKTTMRDIAKAMGLSIGTIYNEFKDKEELVTTLMNREIDHFLVRLMEEENMAKSINDKLYVLTVIRTKMMNDALKNNEPLFDYLTKEPRPLKYIGKIFGGKRKAIDSAILKRLEAVLLTAKSESIINIDNTFETARIFLDAFAEYTSPPDVCNLSLKERTRYAEAMFNLMIFSLMMKTTKG
jgi:AcrR family transcriptional regulator